MYLIFSLKPKLKSHTHKKPRAIFFPLCSMIQTLNVSGRRILTYPAVHPCDAIAPNTLLTLLISLAHDICDYKTEFFPTNNRNAKEVIRQIGVLLVFLEEVRERDPDLPDSVGLCFSELHLAFQKIRYLLEDCTREGSRVQMLMKSERVSNQFRVLIRAISTALDVLLPLGLIDLSDEINSHVELVFRQARKSKFEIDPNDKRVMDTVVSVLNRFENGIVPDMDSIKRVLDYLGIRSWSICNKEMKFLDSEIGLVMSSSDEKNELGELSSLMGFVCYARCVVFDIVDGETSRQSENNFGNGVLGNLNPDDFRCPISLEIMVDPVTIETGHTYDRSSILKWFKTGNPICPKTGTRLKNTELLIPNLVMKKLIQQYCSENGIPFPESGRRNRHVRREILAGCLAAEKAVKMVTKFLSCILATGTKKEKNKAAYEIRLLAKTSIFNRSCLVEAGVIPNLLKLLLSTDSWTQENAIAALLNLSKQSESKAAIVENCGLEYIVDVLKNGIKMEARQHAAGTLFYLASVEEYRILIGDNPETIPALLELIKDGGNHAKKNSLVAIFGLLMHHGNHWRVLASGAMPLLVNLSTSSDREDLVTDSLAILATLAEKIDGTIAILNHGDLESIVKILNSSTSRIGKEYCVSLLLALCTNGGKDVVAVLANNPSLMGYLYSLLTDGTSRAIKKASALIKILHEYCERRSSGSMAPVLPQERSIHVW